MDFNDTISSTIFQDNQPYLTGFVWIPIFWLVICVNHFMLIAPGFESKTMKRLSEFVRILARQSTELKIDDNKVALGTNICKEVKSSQMSPRSINKSNYICIFPFY